ncbi:hypothetical protein PMAYCL1PPCAC_25918, partial [Pristionchus mayeri]
VLEDENRRLFDRVEDAIVRIDYLEGEKLNLEREVITILEESTELAHELDGVRRRLEEMERNGELKDKKLGVFDVENCQLKERSAEAIVRIESLEAEKLNLEEEIKKMLEESLLREFEVREFEAVRGRLEEMER